MWTTLLMNNKTHYTTKNEERLTYKAAPGLSEQLVRHISTTKKEPSWMLDKRLHALKTYQELPLPAWGPDLATLNIDTIHLFVQANAKKNAHSWDDVPEDIRKTYEQLGIPQAERKALGGVGAQYESEIVYHRLKEEWEAQGVIFCDFDRAVHDYPDLIKKYFMTSCVPVTLHKFAALHAALCSGGTFIYVPPGVRVTTPLQAYFRMNAQQAGQFEHTLIIVDKGAEMHYIEGCSAPQYSTQSLHAGCVEIHVSKGARARYSSIENWSKNTYNLNTKRAIVYEDGIIEWVNGNLGSGVTMLYPASILLGDRSRSDYLGVAFAGPQQHQDTGAQVVHIGKDTSSSIIAKSLSAGGGIASYRGIVSIKNKATNSTSSVKCDALMMDNASQSHTYPYMDVHTKNCTVSHEASVGNINDDTLFYLMSRGLDETAARNLVVSGFIEPIAKALPVEYAVEMNRLIELEMEGSLG
ncbi:Fe-S cluster assembly protein SufB [Candidatus Woesearchaeota archaeon]|nr:Fe-S cluster assembly protein SufB [Candidatus Woesearchaeota archaeon]